MARKRMVTRTIASVECTVLWCIPRTATLEHSVVSIPVEVKEEKRMDYIRKNFAELDKVPVSIEKATVIEQLYAMYESDFIAHAFKLDKSKDGEKE